MAEIFYSFLITSLAGTALALVFTISKPLTKRFFSANWNYYVWLCVLLVMMVPIKITLPKMPEKIAISENMAGVEEKTDISKIPLEKDSPQEIILHNTETVPEKESALQLVMIFMTERIDLFAFIWVIGAMLIFLTKTISYIAFLIKVRANSEVIICNEVYAYTKRKIVVRESEKVCSPLIIGVFRPTLLLPKAELTPEQLQNILAHEMTHLKRNDILYKWFLFFAKCLHWFNPAIYFISEQVCMDCEISCDSLVVGQMNEKEKVQYAETILALLTQNNRKTSPLATGMTGNKRTLKKRFKFIKNKKKVNKYAHFASIILASLLVILTSFAGGVLAAEMIGNKNSPQDCLIEVKHNGTLIRLDNTPFCKNGEVFLPLKELLEKTSLADSEKQIKWNSKKITLYLAEKDHTPIYDDAGNITGSNPVMIKYCYGIEIGKAEYTLNPEGSLPSHLQGYEQTKKMHYAPILKDGVAYIPYEYVIWMINHPFQHHSIDVNNKGALFWHEQEAKDCKFYAEIDCVVRECTREEYEKHGVYINGVNANEPCSMPSVENEVSAPIKSMATSELLYEGMERLVFDDISKEKIELELQKEGIKEISGSFADLSKNYIVSDYANALTEPSLFVNVEGEDYKNKLTSIKCDENGNISVYFDINAENLANVTFYDSKTKEEVCSYGILANEKNAYSFLGFDPSRTYTMTVTSKTQDDWDINGSYIIY